MSLIKWLVNELARIECWLKEKFACCEQLMSLYIVGSVFYKSFEEINDVDIVQKILFVNDNKMLGYVGFINVASEEFFNCFGKKLHVTTFTQNDELVFAKFMNLNFNFKVL